MAATLPAWASSRTRAVTSWPCSRSSVSMCDPMNPVAPVSVTFTVGRPPVLIDSAARRLRQSRPASVAPRPRRRALSCYATEASSSRASVSSSIFATARFSSRWHIEEVPGISRTFSRRLSIQARAIWAGLRPRRAAVAMTRWSPRTGLLIAKAEREERHERYAAGIALLEHGHRGPVCQVHRSLHAGDVSDGERAKQMVAGDIAKADAAQPVVSRFHHNGELVVEPLVRHGAVHQSQVERGELADCQGPQVVLDSLPELGRRVVPQHSSRLVPPR